MECQILMIPFNSLTKLSILVSTLLLFCVTPQVTAGEFNPVLNIGDKSPKWTDLPGVDGKKHSLVDLKNEVVLVVFTCNSCPYAVDYEQRLIDFSSKYSDVALVAINVNKVAEDNFDAMKERAKARGFKFTYLFDESQQIARDFGATYTPEFFVLNKERKVVYMGAMDDDPSGRNIKQHYVHDAVASLKKGGQIKTAETIAIGCRIRMERKRRRRK